MVFNRSHRSSRSLVYERARHPGKYASFQNRLVFGLLGSFLLAAASLSPQLVVAQSIDSPFGGFANDNKQPIDIEADELEIKQKENIAVFSGRVNVLQGKVRLQSARLRVKYFDVGKGKKRKREISRLDATGGVIVTSGTQSATGDWATMDVQKNIVTMGDKVVISQDGNVIRGNKVVVDLNTGYSRIISEEKNGGRVKAIFKPKKKN